MSMTAETFKALSTYIKLNLLLCAIALFYQCQVKKTPQSLKYISDEKSLFSE